MALARGFYNRFNAGELSPNGWCNSDLQQHNHGLGLGLNFVGLVAGAAGRRAGFYDVGACAFAERHSRIIPFIRTADQVLMLEFAHGVVRVWQADGTPLLDGSDQVEFASPYGEDQLDGLRYGQSGDLLVLPHLDTAIRTRALVRTDDTTWSIGDYDFRFGPFRPENLDRAFTLEIDGSDLATGDVVTITASADLFDPGHVGALFRIRQGDGNPSNVPSWVADTDFDETIHSTCLSNGRVYAYNTPPDDTTKFGSTQPIHESGTVNDGHIPWTYLHDGAGIVRITAVSDEQNATGVVVTQLPIDDSDTTSFWSEGAYSDYRGWPSAWPTIREDRFVLAATKANPDLFDATRTEGFGIEAGVGYGDFKPGLGTGFVVDDDAVRRRSGEGVARIAWLESAFSLVAGATTSENVITGATVEDPLAPDSTKSRPIGDYGASDAKPAKAHGVILYVAANQETVRAVGIGADQGLTSQDMTVLADHIGERGFAEIAWTKQPDNLLWARLNDGGLATFLFHAEQEVKGWYSQALGGGFVAESLAVAPGQGNRDILWLTAYRLKNGEPQRRIFVGSRRADRMRLDAARLYEGAATGAVTGLLHIANEEALAMVSNDGGRRWAQYGLTVSAGGVATLPDGVTGTMILVGLPILSRAESLPMDLAGPGTTQMARQKLIKAQAAVTGVSFDAGLADDDQLTRYHVERANDESGFLEPKRQVVTIDFDGGHSDEPRWAIECANGYDLLLHALRPLEKAN